MAERDPIELHDGGMHQPVTVEDAKPIIDTARKKYSYDPVTKPTIFKPFVPVRFVCIELQVVLSAIKA